MSTTTMTVDGSGLMKRMLRTEFETAVLNVVFQATSVEEAAGCIISEDPDAECITVTATPTGFPLEDASAAGVKGRIEKRASPSIRVLYMGAVAIGDFL